MANNRMYLRHKITGRQVIIAKYYPETGWYPVDWPIDGNGLKERLAVLFDDDDHAEGRMWGENDYEIVYESLPDGRVGRAFEPAGGGGADADGSDRDGHPAQA